MKRKPVMAGNWKMNLTIAEGVALAQQICDRYEKNLSSVDIVICPVFTGIKNVSNVIALGRRKLPIAVGAQDCYWETSGAFTGEVSAAMVRDAGASYCIIGHSERRQMFGETNETVNKKAHALIAEHITPIMCCGETLETREAGETNAFVTAQIAGGLKGIEAKDVANMILAYEPIWAIGTGKVPTPEAADEVCAAIRAKVAELYDAETANAVRILYGGSVKPANIDMFMPMENIDGALVGGAALKADSFIELIESAARNA